MPAEYNPNHEVFDLNDCGKPMVKAVEALAEKVGEPFDSFLGRTLAEIAQVAYTTYGDELPDFWKVWKEWHAPQPPPRMGDL